LLWAAASAEQMSKHPAALALVAVAKKAKIELAHPHNFTETAGRGVAAQVGGEPILVGRSNWLVEQGVSEHAKLDEKDARIAVSDAVRYLTNNRSRMDYARYRCQGLPVTSALAESLVKQINQRVKGTDKFWNDGSSGTGEGILQIRAAVLCEDARLARWMQNRPISPFSPSCRNTELKTAA
jgi:hypothetical protein